MVGIIHFCDRIKLGKKLGAGRHTSAVDVNL
jgi:hypothetical protein